AYINVSGTGIAQDDTIMFINEEGDIMAEQKPDADTQKKQGPNTPDQPTSGQTEDLEQVKVMAALAYLGILFFLPLVTHPESAFGKFHANQGLLLLLFNIILNTVLSVTVVGLILVPVVFIFSLVLFIMGLKNALDKKMQRLPLIGGFDIIK
ncbi:MAG: hypothetical protein LC687_06235, partial [Actinobacteria bacterium]|nr:hypothetical protein [Actinomycetota bacterium]